MKILIVKTSSLGDVLHTLPALTDAGKFLPQAKFDWVVEEAFAEIPSWHASVEQVVPVAIRRWRKNPVRSLFSAEPRSFFHQLRKITYDMVIDAQGLIKSAIIARIAKGEKVGLNKMSLTEPLARFAYQRTIDVDLQQHAVFRMRSVFAQALGYELPSTPPDYGIFRQHFIGQLVASENYIVFLHGTTWDTKHWPDQHWLALARDIIALGYDIRIPWSNEQEKKRADWLAAHHKEIYIMPRMNLSGIAELLSQAKAVIAVDTGLGHLAAALKIPTISLYGPTNPARVGTAGENQMHVRADEAPCLNCDKPTCRLKGALRRLCLKNIKPEAVSMQLQLLLNHEMEGKK